MKRIIEIAQQKRFEIIKLTVFQTNQQALRLYKKFGFQETGRIKRGVKFPNGTYTDDIIMALNLKT